MKNSIVVAFSAIIAAALVTPASAAIIYSIAGSGYLQTFDSLPNTPLNVSLGSTPVGWKDDDSAPPAGNFSIQGWYLHHPITQSEGGANGNQRMRIGAGTVTTGAFMSFGPSSGATTERALGMLNSNTMAVPGANAYYGARIKNSTDRSLTNFSLAYTGEQWRDGGAAVPNAQSLTFEYSLNATSIQDGAATWTPVAALNFASPTFVNTGAGAATDGNAGANRLAKSVSNQALSASWTQTNDMWIRWADLSDAGNDHGLSIDDLTFSANGPTPPVGVDDVINNVNASVPGTVTHQFVTSAGDAPFTWSDLVPESYTPNYGGSGGMNNPPTLDSDGTFDWNTVGSARGDYVWSALVSNGGGSDRAFLTIHVTHVPEPAAMLLLALALAGMAAVRRER